jgi:Carboxypeptidase regulatory-like domain
MLQRIIAAIALACVVLTGSAFAQVNSSIGGTVQDASQALIPGVRVTASNTQTGVTTSVITNESGAYNIAALIPGSYKVTAELPGFRSQTYSDVQLSGGVPVRLNFTLEVGGVTQTVDVSVASDSALATSSPTIGEVLGEKRVADLPITSNNVLDLVRILPGYRESPGGNAFDTFAGQASNTVNTVRDGLSVTDGRFNNGVFSTTTINPDLVGEVRLILTPVDAELGRGNAQVQIFTRSGTNQYHGSAVWNVRNTALDPNTWLNNHTIDPVSGKTATRNWSNNNEYTISYGGPISKNKTFFYTLWEQQIHRERVLVDGGVLTDTARLGVMRYFDGWNPQRFGVPNTATSTTSTARVFTAVDMFGNPVPPTVNANGSPYSGAGLQCFSVFGTSRLDTSGNMVPFTTTDCPGGSIILPPGGATFWDSNRQAIDSTGFVYKMLLQNMPHANHFGAVTSVLTPDGLNTATVRWIRARSGSDIDAAGTAQTTTGLGDNWDRKQFNVKVDHNFNQRHKFNVGYSLEQNFAETSQPAWPNGYGGDIVRKPHVITSNFTSTLSSNLVNEAKFGMRYNKTDSRGPWENDNAGSIDDLTSFFSGGPDPGYTRASGQAYPVLIGPSGAGATVSSLNFGNNGSAGLINLSASHNGNRSILYTYADTVSWTKGKHAFKFGGEYRPSTSKGYSNISPNLPTPRVYTGAGNFISPLASGGTAQLPAGALATFRGNSAALLYLLSGSIDSVEQAYWIDSYKDVQDGKWQSILTSAEPYRDIIINEASAFAKDDWKITRNLTLNLGARWEYYGSPYVKGGYGTTPHDLGTGLFGINRSTSGGDFDNWLLPAAPIFLSGYGNVSADSALQCTSGVVQAGLPTSNCNKDFLTTVDFFGPESPNPGVKAIPSDYKSLGPAVGFAYQAPWFGGNRMTIRGGYQISYTDARARSTSTLPGGTQAAIGNNPGAAFSVTGATQLTNRFPTTYLDLNSIATIVPGQPIGLPGTSALPLYARASTTTYGWSPDYVTPYVQNFNLSVTTSVRRNMTVDVRYIGTQGRKLLGDINVNTPNIYFNPELLDALNTARNGGDSALLTQMLAGLNFGSGVIGQATTGAAALRTSTGFNQNLINGNFIGVVNTLISGTGVQVTNSMANTGLGVTPSGRLIRNGCDRIASGQTVFNGINLRCFPENYVIANPQLGTATYRMNSGSSNYHSMQAQFTLRPTQGFAIQTTYTWSKTMTLPADSNTNPLNRSQDYTVAYSSIPHDLRTNGTLELPLGPGKWFFANSSGVLARLLERWQIGAILNLSAGRPVTLLGASGLNYGSSTSSTDPNIAVDVVGNFNVRKADLYWDGVNNRGSLFGKDNPYITVTDPQCPATGTGQTAYPTSVTCGLTAVAELVPASTPGAVQYGTDASGNPRFGVLVLQNPRPGAQGNLGQSTFQMPGTFRFDANLSKNIRISESKSVQIRMDATNVLNHPNPLPIAPAISINSASGDFGYLTNGKSGTRQFQAQVRLNF